MKVILLNRVENILAKGEIALILSNFFFCHNVFGKSSAAEASESVFMWERVKKEIVLALSNFVLFPL